jgi:hypothetical protein
MMIIIKKMKTKHAQTPDVGVPPKIQKQKKNKKSKKE